MTGREWPGDLWHQSHTFPLFGFSGMRPVASVRLKERRGQAEVYSRVELAIDYNFEQNLYRDLQLALARGQISPRKVAAHSGRRVPPCRQGEKAAQDYESRNWH